MIDEGFEPKPPPEAEPVGFAKILQGRLKEMTAFDPGARPGESAALPVAQLAECLSNLLEIYSRPLRDWSFMELHELLYRVGRHEDLARDERRPRVLAFCIGDAVNTVGEGEIADHISALKVRTEAVLDFLEDLTPTGCRILLALMS